MKIPIPEANLKLMEEAGVTVEMLQGYLDELS